MKTRTPLNKTLTLSKEESTIYKNKLIVLNKCEPPEKLQNKIICQNVEEVSSFLPEKFVDLMFIDPPYNISKQFNRVSFKSMAMDSYEEWFENWFVKIIRTLKDTASVYICGDWRSSGAILKVGMKYLNVQNRITWEREKGRGAKKNWKNCSEDIWFFTKGREYTFNIEDVKLRRKVLAPYKDKYGKPKDWKSGKGKNYRDTSPSNLWTDISVPFWSMPENTDHPTQKSEKLLAKIVLASSNEGNLVFDPFLGSGASAVVARKLNRNFLGIDIDEYYCMLTLKRLKLAEKNKNIQGYEDEIFWERNTFSEQRKKRKV